MSSNQQHFKTREVHAGVTPDPVTGAILTPIYQTTTYVQESVDNYMAKGYSYSRSGNPTVVALEDRITSLESGTGTACFATGMAATSSIMMALLNAGEHAVASVGEVPLQPRCEECLHPVRQTQPPTGRGLLA